MLNSEVITTLLISLKDEMEPKVKYLKPEQCVFEITFLKNDFRCVCLEGVFAHECSAIGCFKRMLDPLELAYR